jgi:hypothetical protein
MSDEGKSIAMWDLAPDDGGGPVQFQVWSTAADGMIAANPSRYRLVRPGDETPTERSDGKPINPDLSGGAS